MTQDVRQWLAEIRNLQQKLDAAHRERDEAYGSAANWRSLYETEAQQRRNDAAVAQQKLEALTAELASLQSDKLPALAEGDAPDDLRQQVATLATEELRSMLVQALVECDRLSQALTAEQESHAKTRQELTAALGDTIEQLSRTRTLQNAGASPSTTGESGEGNHNRAE